MDTSKPNAGHEPGLREKKRGVESIRKIGQETDMTIGLAYINKHASHHTATGTTAKVPINQLEKLASIQPENIVECWNIFKHLPPFATSLTH
jgi:hypothetical protein